MGDCMIEGGERIGLGMYERKAGRKGRGEDGVGLLVLVVLILMMIIRYFRCTTTTTTTTSTLRFLCEGRSSVYVYACVCVYEWSKVCVCGAVEVGDNAVTGSGPDSLH